MAASGMIAAKVGPRPLYNVNGPSFLAIERKAAPTPWLYLPTWSHVMRLRTTSRGCRMAVLVAPAKAAEDRTLTGPCPILCPMKPCRNWARFHSRRRWQLKSELGMTKRNISQSQHNACKQMVGLVLSFWSLIVHAAHAMQIIKCSAVAVYMLICGGSRLPRPATSPCTPQKRRSQLLFEVQHAVHSSHCLSTVLASLDHWWLL